MASRSARVATLQLSTPVGHSRTPSARRQPPALRIRSPSSIRVPTASWKCARSAASMTHPEAVNAAPGSRDPSAPRPVQGGREPRRAGRQPPDTDGTYSFEFHQLHPNDINLIAVLGGLHRQRPISTIAGWDGARTPYANRATSYRRRFQKHVGIRCDKADVASSATLHLHARRAQHLRAGPGRYIKRRGERLGGRRPRTLFATDHGIASNCEPSGPGTAGSPGRTGRLSQLATPYRVVTSRQRLCTGPGSVRLAAPAGTGTCTRAADNNVCHGPGDRFTCCTGAGAAPVSLDEVKFCKSYHNAWAYSARRATGRSCTTPTSSATRVGFVDDSETDHPNIRRTTAIRSQLRYDQLQRLQGDSRRHDHGLLRSIYWPWNWRVLATGTRTRRTTNYFWTTPPSAPWLASAPRGRRGGSWTIRAPRPPFVSPATATRSQMSAHPASSDCDEADCRNAQDFDWDGLATTQTRTQTRRAPRRPASPPRSAPRSPIRSPAAMTIAGRDRSGRGALSQARSRDDGGERVRVRSARSPASRT